MPEEYAHFESIEPAAAPTDPNASGEPSLSAAQIAAEAAAHVARDLAAPASRPGESFTDLYEEHPLLSEEAQFITQELPADYDEEVPSVEEVAEEFETPTPLFSKEDLLAFEQAGIDLPISVDEIPQGFESAYMQMAQAILDSHAMSAQATQEALEVTERIADFAQRLNTAQGQERMLLAIAMQNPEVFDKTLGQIQRMQDDPEYAEVLRRSMEAEVREEALNRREKSYNQTRMMQKAQQVRSRAERLATRLGVDVGWAKEQVAQRILLNEQTKGQRDISLAEVDEVVKGLAQRVAAKAPPRVATPQRQARVQQTPQQPAAPAGRTPSQAPPSNRTAPGGSENHWTEGLRAGIRAAATRARKAGL